MYILDKKTDYYDYHSYVYGLDKSITYDRKESVLIQDIDLLGLAGVLSVRVKPNRRRFSLSKDYYFLLEVGGVQYLFEVKNIKWKHRNGCKYMEEVSSYELGLTRVFRDNIHRFTTPISLQAVQVNWAYYGKHRKAIKNAKYQEVISKVDSSREIRNPILAASQLTKFIDGKEIWVELQTYISSLDNDVDVSIPTTDVEKAEIHGFDRTTSFRHPVK